MTTTATVIVVCFGTTELDLRWVPPEAEVLVVHNDALDVESAHPRVRHLGDGRNIGFGPAVNLAAQQALGMRLLIVNPDAQLREEHFSALVRCSSNELGTVPTIDGDGTRLPVVNRYPTPLTHLASILRLGRLAPLGSRRRQALGQITRFGRTQSHASEVGTWPLSGYWVSGAILSVEARAFALIGGFDEAYFLYFEDVDLSARLPLVGVDTARVCNTTPATHTVGGSATGRPTDHHRRAAALTYAKRNPGLGWRASTAFARALRPRR